MVASNSRLGVHKCPSCRQETVIWGSCAGTFWCSNPRCPVELKDLGKLEEQLDALEPPRKQGKKISMIPTVVILIVSSATLALCSVTYLTGWRAIGIFCLAWILTFLAGLAVGLSLIEEQDYGV